MVDGIHINVSKEEFIQKPPGDQNWMLFMSIQQIDQKGCHWSKSTYGSTFWKKFYIFATALGAGIVGAVTLIRWWITCG